MESAFGVEHGEISKAGSDNRHKYSTGRAVAATSLGGYHSAFAAKKGKKLRATGRSIAETVGGGALGGITGTVAGLATKKPSVASAGNAIGGAAGSLAGSYHAFRSNNRKGYYKKQSSK